MITEAMVEAAIRAYFGKDSAYLGDPPRCHVDQEAMRAALEAAERAAWQPIETAPKMKNILLFAVTDVREDGAVGNWKMATGAWIEGHKAWEWAGRVLKAYDIQPTYWCQLPDPPLNDAPSSRGSVVATEEIGHGPAERG